MHEVIKAASRALSANDPHTLERLAGELEAGRHTIRDEKELRRAVAVLAAQVDAAAAHIALRSKVLTVTELYGVGLCKR